MIQLCQQRIALLGTDIVEAEGKKHRPRKKKRKAKKREPEEEEVEEVSMEGEAHPSEGMSVQLNELAANVIQAGHGAGSTGRMRDLPALPDELQQPSGEEQEQHATDVGGREIFRHELSCPNGEILQ